jgi:hypothetical protein
MLEQAKNFLSGYSILPINLSGPNFPRHFNVESRTWSALQLFYQPCLLAAMGSRRIAGKDLFHILSCEMSRASWTDAVQEAAAAHGVLANLIA